ncbi:MAG TPA: glycosyltransferase [Gemmatimonadales bacterium]|nr:glycosyltransferase [Gemmatimonadales bacterium]
MNSTRLGEVLLARGLITAEQLETALRQQRRTGEKLGRLLLILGYVSRLQLAQALADRWRRPFLTIAPDSVDVAVAQRFPLDATLRLRAVPIRDTGTEVVVASAEEPGEELHDTLAVVYPGRQPDIRITTEWDIDRAIALTHRRKVVDTSIYGLYFRDQAESAFTVFTLPQYLAFSVACLVLLAGLWSAPLQTLLFLNVPVTLFMLAVMLFRTYVGVVGAGAETAITITPGQLEALEARELPVYTILVPAYKEARVIGNLLRSLAALDYPADKLDIILLFEEDDPETLAAAKAAAPGANVRFMVVPAGEPQTKPKACNVGLLFAQGEYLVIYDAEDRPEPDQLKKALLAFRQGPRELACVQAALNYYNWNENFLTRMFTLEYSFWFDYLLPGLDRLRLPIPLGGTSNHFKTAVLRELGGWDPFNVTEDADLGIRAAMHGYRVGIVNSTTYEEANKKLGNWLRQRSRWIKGYMQTALVFSRDPIGLVRRAGLRQAIGFVLLIGGTPLIFLMQPIAIGLTILWLVTRTQLLTPLFPPWLLYISLFNLLFGNVLAIYVNMFAVFKRRLHVLVLFSILNPAYWLLHSMASFKALGQLFTRPYYWEKTTHGLTRHGAAAA